jgi:hypothetical protein
MAAEENEAFVLNPFPFLAETHFRLAVLVLLAVAVALALGHAARFSYDMQTQVDLTDCASEALGDVPFKPAIAGEAVDEFIEELKGTLGSLVRCLKQPSAGAGTSLLPLAAVGLLTTVVALQIVLGPWFVARRAGLAPPPPVVRAELEARIAAIGLSMGVKRSPRLYWAPLDGRPRAFVFGSDRRPRLAVTYGAVAAGLGDRLGLDALLAHELAHIANRDVSAWIMSRAVFHGVLYVLAPLSVAILFFHRAGALEPSQAVGEMLRLGGALALLALAQASVLRVRERAADLRACLDPERREALAAHIGAVRPLRPAWLRLLDVYPSTEARIRGLGSTEDFFRPPVWSAAAFGFALSVIGLTVFFLGFLFAVEWLSEDIIEQTGDAGLAGIALVLAPGAALGALVSAALGPLVWRASLAEALGAVPRVAARVVTGPALGAAAGATFGLFASLVGGTVVQGAVRPVEGVWLQPAVNRAALAAIAIGVFFFFFWLQFLWMHRTAHAWSSPLVRHAWGEQAALPLSLAAGLPFAVLAPSAIVVVMAFLAFGEVLAAAGAGLLPLAPYVLVSAIAVTIGSPLAPPALVLIAVLPLAAAAARGGTAKGWFVLAGRPPRLPSDLALRPRRALLIGIGFGIAASLLAFGTPLYRVLTEVEGLEAWQVLAGLSTIPGLAGFAGAVAAPRLRFEHGLLACLTASGTYCFAFALMGANVDFAFLWLDLVFTALVGMPLALLGAAARGGLSGLRRRVAPPA